jgi:broad specificity phosphatase PhoE
VRIIESGKKKYTSCFQKDGKKLMRHLIEVNPCHESWAEFLDLSYTYISESWPDATAGIPKDEFVKEYATSLTERIAQGGRGLFIYKDNSTTVGLANVYLDRESHICLNVAEFYVTPSVRKVGQGKNLLYLIEQWGRNHRAEFMSAEVDKDQVLANLFWSSLADVQVDKTGDRNVYRRNIPQLRLIWIRHGSTEKSGEKGYFPPEDQIILSREGELEVAQQSQEFQKISSGAPIYVSPLIRAKRTTQLLTGEDTHTHEEVTVVNELREVIVDELIGMKIDEIRTKYGIDAESRYLENPTKSPFQNSESIQSAQIRCLKAIKKTLEQSHSSINRFVIGHGTLHAIFLLTIRGMDLADTFKQDLRYLHGSIYTWDHSKDVWHVKGLNLPINEISLMLSGKKQG